MVQPENSLSHLKCSVTVQVAPEFFLVDGDELVERFI